MKMNEEELLNKISHINISSESAEAIAGKYIDYLYFQTYIGIGLILFFFLVFPLIICWLRKGN